MNKYVERLYNGIIKENPTFVLMLGTDLSVLSAEAVHLHVRQGDRWLSLLRQ